MTDIPLKLQTLKDKLETAAFLVGKGGSDREVHSEIIQSLVLVAEIEANLPTPGGGAGLGANTNQREANKVRRRLRLWARRPHQINSRILNAYLQLKRSGEEIVTESMLRNALPGESSFDSNFTQMKTIAEKNHGKIFDQHGEQVSIWAPIVDDVAEYERIVFKKGEFSSSPGDESRSSNPEDLMNIQQFLDAIKDFDYRDGYASEDVYTYPEGGSIYVRLNPRGADGYLDAVATGAAIPFVETCLGATDLQDAKGYPRWRIAK